MTKITATPKPTRAYIRASRHHSEAMQRELLLDAGYRADKTYVEGVLGIVEMLKAINGRSYRIGVTTLGRLAKTRELLREVMLEIVGGGSIIHEVTTGREIATKREAEAAAMAFDATRELTGDARGPTKKEARERGKLGGEARAAALAEKLAEERLADDKTRKIWLDAKSGLTNRMRLARMPGWTDHSARKAFGMRKAAQGRPRKDQD